MRLLPSPSELEASVEQMEFSSSDDRNKALLFAQLWACKAQCRLLREAQNALTEEMAEVAGALAALAVHADLPDVEVN